MGRRKGQQEVQSSDGAAADENILVIKGDFQKKQENDLLQMLAKFGKITDSNLKPSRISEGEKNKGKKIVGSGVITFAKPGPVKTLAGKGNLDFKGKTIKMKQKGGAFPSEQREGVKKRPKNHDADEERVQRGGCLARWSPQPATAGHVVHKRAADENGGSHVQSGRISWRNVRGCLLLLRWRHDGVCQESRWRRLQQGRGTTVKNDEKILK